LENPSAQRLPALMALADKSNEQSLIRPYVALNLEDAFLTLQCFKDEVRELELWLRGQKGKVTGDWLLRVKCLRDLPQMELRNNSTKRKDRIQYSEALARRI
jgi:hypothetical protein